MQCGSNTGFASRLLIVGAVAALASAPLRGPAQAGDDAGVREFIASQAARTAPEPRAPVVASAPTEATIQRYFGSPATEQRHRARLEKARAVSRVAAVARRPKVHYATLSERDSRPAPKKQKVDLPADPVAALLRDPTLQPGDVVVLREGAKVFSGPGKFEPVEQSRLLSKSARKAVLAMTQPAQTVAGQARQKLAASAPIVPAGAAFASAVRVVYPQLRTQDSHARAAYAGN